MLKQFVVLKVGTYFYYAALEKFFDLLQAQRVMLFTYKSRGN